jgi:N-acylneuraminate cytidylyltransferase
VRAALRAGLVTRVVCSTDDPAIADAAAAAGAEVPFLRPAALAADDTPDLPVFRHLLAWLAEHEAYRPDVLVHLRPTSPVRPDGLVDEAVTRLLGDPEADSVRSLSPPPKTPYKMWQVRDGRLQPLLGTWDEALFDQPRQALPEVWVHDGVLDVVRTGVVEAGSMSGRQILPFHTPPGCAVDIDTAADLEQAARLLAAARAAGEGRPS